MVLVMILCASLTACAEAKPVQQTAGNPAQTQGQASVEAETDNSAGTMMSEAVATEPSAEFTPSVTLVSKTVIVDDRGGEEIDDDTDVRREDIHLPDDAGDGSRADEDIVEGHDEVPDDSVYGGSYDGIEPWIYEDGEHPGCHRIDIRGMLAYLWGIDEGQIVGSVSEFLYGDRLVYFTDVEPGTNAFQTAVVEYSCSVAYKSDPSGEYLGVGDSSMCIATSLAVGLYERVVEAEQSMARVSRR